MAFSFERAFRSPAPEKSPQDSYKERQLFQRQVVLHAFRNTSLSHGEMMTHWISGGFAEKFSELADAGKVDLSDTSPEAYARLLDEIGYVSPETMH